MKTKIILLRHGQSVSNLNRVFTGQVDAPLTPLGEKQVKASAEILSGEKIDAVYSSELIRAKESARPFAKERNLKIIALSELNECFFGEWGGKSYDAVREEYPKEYDIFRNNIGFFRAPNGESIKDVWERVSKTVDRIVSENKGKTVLIATHGLVIKSLLTLWQNKGLEDMQAESVVSNASLSFIEHENGCYNVLKKGYDEHLEEIKTSMPKL